MHKYTLTLTDSQFESFLNSIFEKAMELQDDGNDDDPNAAVLYLVAKQLKGRR